MARNVTPTRHDYLETQKKLQRTEEGYDLLEQKRQILVLEMMAQVEAARRVKEEVTATMAAAYEALARAAVSRGITGLMRQSCGIVLDHRISYRARSVMGVPVPQVTCRPEPLGLRFSLMDGRSYPDEVMRRFLEALEHVARLAEVENAVVRLAREIKRTQRRVRALEKTFIPRYKKDLKYIEEALAERQREEFIVLRKVKNKRRAALPEPGARRAGRRQGR